MGGLARRATLIKQARSVERHLLLLDGGNTLTSPDLTDSPSVGRLIVEAMNSMSYDAMALGEIDLRLGEEALRQMIAEARFPVLSANVIVQSTGELLCRPYAVLDVGDLTVGIIGLTGLGDSAAAEGSPDKSLEIADPVAVLSAHMQELRNQAQVIIVLCNLDWDASVQLAESVPGIDLIVSTGRGQLLTDRWTSPKAGTLVCVLGVYHRENPTLSVNTIDLEIDDTGGIVEYSGSFVHLGSGLQEDPEMQELVDRYLSQ